MNNQRAEMLELEVLTHRYLYYVLAEPIVSDSVYDQIEKEARAICDPSSPVHGIGSSLPSSYSLEAVKRALQLRGIK